MIICALKPKGLHAKTTRFRVRLSSEDADNMLDIA